MDFIDNMIAERLGGNSFFKQSKTTYKFEKIKNLTQEVIAKNPGIRLIDMGVGEPDQRADDEIIDILNTEARKLENRFYSDNGIEEFKIAAYKYLKKVYNLNNINEKNIMHGIGSKSILATLPLCFINEGDICIMPKPAYQVLGTNTKYLGGEVYEMPINEENNFLLEFEKIPKEILEKTKMIYINYPNNPTGHIATKEYYEKLIKFAKENKILVVCDAAYSNLTYDGYKPLSIMSIDGAIDVCIEIHSLSKSFNMTGWRIGFIVANEKIIKAYGCVKSNIDSGQFRAIQLAGAYALENSLRFVEKNINRYDRRLNMLVKALREIGFDAKKPQGGFYIYTKIPKGIKNNQRFENAEQVSLYILEKCMISTVPWDDSGSYLRFSVTYEAKDIEDEKYIMQEIKKRMKSLDLEF